MKKLHGSDLVMQARAHYQGPVIMLSAGSPDAVSSVQVIAEELGADFLEKPLRSITDLEELVVKYAPK
jgi:DNA-binding response OmpR family regulator